MEAYLKTMQDVLDNGVWQKNERTGEMCCVLDGAMTRFDLRKGFPAVTTKPLAWKGVRGEFVGFLRGVTSAWDFRTLGCKVWDANANENAQWLANPFREGEDHLGDIYGAQWRRWPAYKLVPEDNKAQNDLLGTTGWECIDELRDTILPKGYPMVYHNLWYKEIDQLGDCIRKIILTPSDRRILFHGWNPAKLDEIALPACFHRDTLIATPGGYACIDVITKGDYVLSGTGIPRKVNHVWETYYRGAMRRLSVRYQNLPIDCTPNHPFLIKGKGWVEAKNLIVGDQVAIPKPITTNDFHTFSYAVKQGIKNNPDGVMVQKTHTLSLNDYFVLGYFLGNGWVNDRKKQINFAIPHHKRDKILPIIRETIKVCAEPEHRQGVNVAKYEAKNQQWYSICKELGRGAFNKMIPEWVFTSCQEAREAFFNGYIEADGCVNDAGTIMATTISPRLAFGMQRLCTTFNKVMSVRKQKRPPFTIIEGRKVRQNDTYSLTLPKTTQNNGMEYDDEFVWLPITEIIDYEDDLIVYNLDVEEEHTYMVYNIATHNCHLLYQFLPSVATKELSLTIYIRSWDVLLGGPFNIAEGALLLHLVAQLTGYVAKNLTIFSGDTHIYESGLSAVKEQLKREPFPLPKLVIDRIIPSSEEMALIEDPAKRVEVAIDYINKVNPWDFQLEGYQHHPALEFVKMAV